MNIITCLKMVPDVVEELEVGSDGKSLDTGWLRLKLSEPDEHALEQSLLLKERHGGKVTAVAFEAPELEEALFTALAKGADRAIKIIGDFSGLSGPVAAQILSTFLRSDPQLLTSDTLILTGSQAIDDLEGELSPCLAEGLGFPYIGVVTGIELEPEGKKALVMKEFAGGLRGEFEVPIPAVLGIQAAEKPPRYVPVAKVRSVMKTMKIEPREVPCPDSLGRLPVEQLYKPEVAGMAEMIEGSPNEIAERLVEILSKRALA
ncbi:MAG: electron transfer flavoprotein subunit beta/FixA family protein [Acidobacteriia bacterium]|nr:electron transfer flavoprotein subunit beta/FixA family protein [Terriglobia bacterium]